MSLSPIAAWGENSYGQTNVPVGLSNVVAIASGGNHSLALLADGNVVAWGGNSLGQTNVPAALSNVVAIAGGYHSLALRADGTVAAWGSGGGTNVPFTLSNVVSIAAGDDYSLAVRADGTVAGWGRNSYNWYDEQFNHYSADSGQATPPQGLSNVVAVAAGSTHSLALRRDGTVASWGIYGSVGPEDWFTVLRLRAGVPEGLSNVVAIAAGYSHSLALRADGTVVAWGTNNSIQSGVPAGLTNVVAISARDFHNLALTAGGIVVAWAGNNYGQANVPAGLSNVVAIAAGESHSLALTEAVEPQIAVQPSDQAMGPGGSAAFGVVVRGTPPVSYQWQHNGTNVGGATNPNLAIDNLQSGNAGEYRVVVSNRYGNVTSQAAVLTVSLSPVIARQPQSLTGLLRNTVSFPVEAYGELPLTYQWLKDDLAIAGAAQPTLVLNTLQWSDLGSYSILVSNAHGTATSQKAQLALVPIAAWGANSYGQASVPAGLSNIVAVAGGGSYNLALKVDGSVVAWGNYNQGQTNLPAGLSNVVAIAAGQYHSLALRADGRVIAWGIYNCCGQTNVPADLKGVVAIAARGYHQNSVKGVFWLKKTRRPNSRKRAAKGRGAPRAFPTPRRCAALGF